MTSHDPLGDHGDDLVPLGARPVEASKVVAGAGQDGEREVPGAQAAIPVGSGSGWSSLVGALSGEPTAWGQTSALVAQSAVAFTARAMLRPQATPPTGGWRQVVYRATWGRVNPGPSQAELAERQLAERVAATVVGSRRVAVISRKGGVGKTTTTLLVGHTFAAWRGDRVVALDANPDAGSLAYRVHRRSSATVTDLLAHADRITRYADLRGYTSQASSRLEVIAADDDPHISTALGAGDYRAVIDLLDHHYNLILLDTGTGILDSGAQGVLASADQLLVVAPPALDGARVAAQTLDWLDAHGHGQLVRHAVVVLNGVRPRRGTVDVSRLAEHFASRCAAVVPVPWDPHLEAGAEVDLHQLRPATRRAYLELAAAAADGFGSRTVRDRDKEDTQHEHVAGPAGAGVGPP